MIDYKITISPTPKNIGPIVEVVSILESFGLKRKDAFGFCYGEVGIYFQLDTFTIDTFQAQSMVDKMYTETSVDQVRRLLK